MANFPEVFEAIRDATKPDGVFSVVAKQSLIHPNKEAAYQVLRQGTVDLSKVPFMAMARPLSRYEKEAFRLARERINTTTQFVDVYVVDVPYIYMTTFAGYLLLAEQALADRHLTSMIAHELGHVNNGSTFVLAAFCFLGKGWGRENITPLGVVKETDEEKLKRIADDASDFTRAVLYSGWLGGAVVVAGKMVRGVGSSVQKFDTDITKYFQRWDIDADAKAEKWVGVLEYQSYLADWRDQGGSASFDAPASMRLEESEHRQQPQPVPVALPAPPKKDLPIWAVASIVVAVMFGGLVFLAIILLAIAVNG